MKRDGQFITANLNLHRFKDDEDNTVYFEGSMQDITESERIKSELIKAKESAEIANRLKSEFLAQMSHEIRTPIHALLAFTNLMKEEMNEHLEFGTEENYEIIDSAGKRIIRTIDLILNMSELQTGTYEKVLKKFDIYKDVIRRLNAEFTTQAEMKGLKIAVKKMTDETYLIADQYSVEQILSNLLSNAIKYTNKGLIEIIVSRNQADKLVVSVADSGIGISEEYLSQIFDAFSQEETGYSRRFEGNGLGLALVKKYCELNDASISVTSKKGEGSTFKIVFN
ncbi:MAG: HAMP domain-containing histidine kinase [Melioribacteraceae bacterium]|nr:HAMP domain-containing histidine kinase [Melioribacteraceae bacterium]MCF8355960.1 HAMP domain-containing histidine kinase [Melioribacteraceae bacterium]MCF8395493.1 HAMP domain-containing histidine kinase [Melioribacteraceae bacterium]MCF8420833.1 HAMP domain-containing histidine kinase [Melioribacteraceae bacterium]